jgi:hypothetical protein
LREIDDEHAGEQPLTFKYGTPPIAASAKTGTRANLGKHYPTK